MNKTYRLDLSAFIAVILMGSTCFSARAEDALPPVATPVFPNTTLNLTDFGAVGDGVTLNTEAFSNAIASLAEEGGGELIVPPGFWLTGPIQLRSNINLHLERGALIKFSGDYHLYPLRIMDLKGEKEVTSTPPLLGENLENVGITGDGIIDGSGEAWRPMKKDKETADDWNALVKSGGVVSEKGDTWWPSADAMAGDKAVDALQKSNIVDLAAYEPYHQHQRPKMICLVNCKKVLLQGVTYENPPNWTVNPALCEDVSILNVNIHNSYAAQNSDALDLESCTRAIIKDSTFDAGDDGICIKSGRDETGRKRGMPTRDILVKDCTVYHAHGGFVVGSEMSGGVRNIHVDNCTFIGTDVGLRFKSARGRGGVVEKIYISNIRMINILTDAINFSMFYTVKVKGITNNVVSEGTPKFQDIHVDNLVCRGAHSAIVLNGLQEMPIHNIDFNNVSITSDRGVFLTDADGIHFQNVHVENKSGPLITQVRVANSSVDLVP